MSQPRVVLVTVALAAAFIALPAGGVRAQCGGAYTDEMAGPGGTYETSAECATTEGETFGVGMDGVPTGTTVAGRDNPDAPPVYDDTATFEGERER